jgi:hypothetical protein
VLARRGNLTIVVSALAVAAVAAAVIAGLVFADRSIPDDANRRRQGD